MNNTPLIVGAGLAGLLAAHAWPTARVIEAAPAPRAAHKALLRFRTDGAARLTGTEFRKVRVRKGIFSRGRFCAPDIRLCNQYAQKTVGVLRDRSIWNIESVDRYVAPEDWYDQLLAVVGGRIEWGTEYVPSTDNPLVVSTAPMPVILQHHDINMWSPREGSFRRSAIRVTRYRIPNADVYQTVYFPDPDTSIYRASITGSLLIIEEAIDHVIDHRWLDLISEAFGIDPMSLESVDATEQSYGKVDELEPRVRKQVLFRLTSKYNVYSLGRFATWRNILLDDVVDDIAVIKRLINQANSYELSKHSSK